MRKNILAGIICLFMVLTLSGCGKSANEKAMDAAVETANKLLEKKETPYDKFSCVRKPLTTSVVRG